MLKFILAFLFAPMAIASTGYQTSRPVASNAAFSTFTIANDCQRLVTIAVNWQLPDNDSGFWFTNWFIFEPNTTHQLVNTDAKYVYIYANTIDERSVTVWNGKCTETSYLPDVVYDESHKLYGCTFPVYLGVTPSNVTYHLTCN